MGSANRDYLNVDSDWRTAGNWAGTVVPVTTEDVRISASIRNLSVGLSAQSAVVLDQLFVGETYTGNIGGTGNPLSIDVFSVATIRSGGDECWLKGDFPEVHAAPLNHTTNALVLETRVGGSIKRLYCERGRTTISGVSSVVDVFMLPGANDAKLIIQGSTTVSGDIHVSSGTVEIDGTCSGTIYVSGTGELVITANAAITKIRQDGGTVTWEDGVINGGTFTAGVRATETLTLSGNLSNNDTVVIDTKTYTFQTVLTDFDGNVKIGASAAATATNLIKAMSLGVGSGTDYAASMTIHPTCLGSEVSGSDAVLCTANTAGTAGNSIVSTETSATASWGAATLSGGVVEVDDPTIRVTGGFFDAHLLFGSKTVTSFWAVGSVAKVNLRTGQRNVIRTNSKAIGAPQLLLDDGDTF